MSTSGPASDQPAALPPAPNAGLPEQTTDDTDAGWGEGADPDRERWLLGERPPHWE